MMMITLVLCMLFIDSRGFVTTERVSPVTITWLNASCACAIARLDLSCNEALKLGHYFWICPGFTAYDSSCTSKYIFVTSKEKVFEIT